MQSSTIAQCQWSKVEALYKFSPHEQNQTQERKLNKYKVNKKIGNATHFCRHCFRKKIVLVLKMIVRGKINNKKSSKTFKELSKSAKIIKLLPFTLDINCLNAVRQSDDKASIIFYLGTGFYMLYCAKSSTGSLEASLLVLQFINFYT